MTIVFNLRKRQTKKWTFKEKYFSISKKIENSLFFSVLIFRFHFRNLVTSYFVFVYIINFRVI